MTQRHSNQRLIAKLLGVVAGMFAFGFALVPLYDVFCDITGINGKTSDQAASYQGVIVDESREVTIEFITRTQGGMPWEFSTQTKRLKVNPGRMEQVDFYVRNPTSRDIVGQAVPSVSPGPAALYINKTECFCFNNQPLAAGADATMPMRFYIDPEMPEHIRTLTLQYTFFDVTQDTDTLAMLDKGD